MSVATALLVAASTAALVMCSAVGVSMRWRLRPADPRLPRPAPARPRRGPETRRRRQLDADRHRAGIAVLEHTARDLRAGSSLAAALTEALEAHPLVLDEVRDGLRRGQGAHATIEAALAAQRPPMADERLLLQAVRACRDAGRRAPEVLDRAADVLRERQAWRRERQAQAAQVRLSGRVLTALPVVFALWSVMADEGVRAAYVSSPLPAVCAAIGGVLNLAGWWWMRRLTGRDA